VKAGQKVHIIVDILMIALLSLLMLYSLVGEALHEWMGIIMSLLFILHNICNWRWYKSLVKGKYSALRTLLTVINILLVIIMVSLPISGIMMSRHIFVFFDLSSGMAMARTVHLLASHWGLVLMSLHLGLHWNRIMGVTKKMLHIKQPSIGRTILLRMIALHLCVYGIYAFVDLQFGAYLFLNNQFVFFDFSKPLVLNLAERVAILCLFCSIGYYGSKLLQMIKRSRRCGL
jgi:hypothetical protein